MPFQSSNQMKAAFAGGLGPEMQAKAPEWAHETPNIASLPQHVNPLIRGDSRDAIASNVGTLKQRGMNEFDATRSALKQSKPYNNRHTRLGKFLHPRKDGKPHGSDFNDDALDG